MSADVLRRAAARLREHAGHFVTTAWHSSNDTPYTSVRTEAGWALLSGVYSDTSRYATEYAALLHPPVALALAGWLDAEAENIANAVAAWSRDTGYIDKWLGGVEAHAENMFAASLTVARAILREDS